MVKPPLALVVDGADVDDYITSVEDVRVSSAFDVRITVGLGEPQHVHCESLVAVKGAIVSPNDF